MIYTARMVPVLALPKLSLPIIAAPMAGGVSTPELVVAAERAGAMGFLAAGYLSVDQLTDQIIRTRGLGGRLFGVNLFVPDSGEPDLSSVRAYRESLLPLATRFGLDGLPTPVADDDQWQAKLAVLLHRPVPVVSFTFGCPDGALIQRLHAIGTTVLATVTSPIEAEVATSCGADALIVQGPEAGGHRATFTNVGSPSATALPDLIAAVGRVTDRPLIAAGGVCTPAAFRAALESAAVVQVGTALLDATEAGTSPVHRRALRDRAFTQTVVTRAFSGRPARGLRNAFVDEFDMLAPAVYPAVNQVTGPIRRAAAAAGDLQHVHLWAGTGWQDLPTGSAVAIIAHLTGSIR